MATLSTVAAERVLLHGVSWKAYEALLECWADRPVRLTYDRGRLEIMSPLRKHEKPGAFLKQMIELFTLGMKIPRETGGSMTFRKEAAQRGLEPDGCYWIQNVEAVRGTEEFDGQVDPPPDLVIEIDITSSSLDRMSIYAALGVPEVWRFDGVELTVNLLQHGQYIPSEQSLALPGLPLGVVRRFLDRRTEDEVTLLSSFQAWVRKQARGRGAGRSRRPPRK
jgi:Uma2 family endonuclease